MRHPQRLWMLMAPPWGTGGSSGMLGCCWAARKLSSRFRATRALMT